MVHVNAKRGYLVEYMRARADCYTCKSRSGLISW